MKFKSLAVFTMGPPSDKENSTIQESERKIITES